MHLSKEEILKLSLTSQDLLEICTHVKYKSPVFFGLKLQSKIFLSRLKTKGPKGPLSLTWVQWTREKCWNGTKTNSGFRGKVENVSANQMPGRPFSFFPIGLKNTNMEEGIESLLPVKFRWIPFSGFFREVENVSANQRPGRPFCFFRSARKTRTW